jgi:nicotinamide mononucleotide transporter
MIELIAIIFSLLSIWLTIRRNIYCWLVGIIGIVCYFLIFLEDREWGNVSLQILFILQSIIGWITWNSNDNYKNVTKVKNKLYVIIPCLLFTLSYYLISSRLGGNNIILDSMTTGLSIVGMSLLSMKKLEAWICWIIADILYIPFFINGGHYMSSFIYLIFLILAIIGYNNWKNEITKKI